MSDVVREVHRIREALREDITTLHVAISSVDQRVISVETIAQGIDARVNSLYDDFNYFVYKQQRANALSKAQQEKIALTQKLERQFGHYDQVRRTLIGVLEHNDLAMVRDESILGIAESLVTTASRYWLAPVLVALARWIGNDAVKANEALRKAMDRDDEKTSLTFSLICRRVNRLDASRIWLERYFGMQDPTDMQQMAIVMLDAMSGGLFGADENSMCLEKVTEWVTELSEAPGFIEKQMEQWKKALKGKAVTVEGDLLDEYEKEFPTLAEYSPTWPEMTNFLGWALSHAEFYEWFTGIFSATSENTSKIAIRIDDILLKLANDFDVEEYPIRKDLRKNILIIDCDGDEDEAAKKFELETSAYESKVDFSEILTTVAMNTTAGAENLEISNSTRKFAIALTREWIRSAYDDLTALYRSNRPQSIAIKIKDWAGETRDGSNEEELTSSLSDYVEALRAEELSKVKIAQNAWVFLGIGILWLLFAPFANIIGLAGAALFALRYWQFTKRKADVIGQIDEVKANWTVVLRAFLAEVVDFNALCDENDADSKLMHEFFVSLNENEYVKNMSLKR
jgi:hypothetical protein